eukprot:1802070-Prorocentrum_lima.AAC.1
MPITLATNQRILEFQEQKMRHAVRGSAGQPRECPTEHGQIQLSSQRRPKAPTQGHPHDTS